MSHLSILPTVLEDADTLIAALRSLGLRPTCAGLVRGFGGEHHPVDVQIALSCGQSMGWQRQHDGRLALIADLQRLGRSASLQRLLGRITRSYAAHAALRQASQDPGLRGAEVLLNA